MSLRILSAVDVERISAAFSPGDLQCLMAQVFHAVSSPPIAVGGGEGVPNVQTPHRTTIETDNHRILFMPARFGADCSTLPVDVPLTGHGTSIKIVSAPKQSDPRGLPGTTVVLDEATGGVKAVVNARTLTALRNAAGRSSLLSTSLIAKRAPRHIVAFGAGNQILAHLDLHIRFFPQVQQCTIINRTLNERVERVLSRLSQSFRRVSLASLASGDSLEVEKAVKSADLIVCATSSTEPLFPSAWVNAGTHVILIGSYTLEMQEVDSDLIKRALPENVLIVDSKEACSKEAGELIKANIPPSDVLEIGELLPVTESGELDVKALQRRLNGDVPRSTAQATDFIGPITLFNF